MTALRSWGSPASEGSESRCAGQGRSRESLLDPFKPYLHERFNAGHSDSAALTTQITEMGYRGSDKTVRRYLQPFRASQVAPRTAPVPPSVRRVTGWLTRRPRSLSEEEALELKRSSTDPLPCPPHPSRSVTTPSYSPNAAEKK